MTRDRDRPAEPDARTRERASVPDAAKEDAWADRVYREAQGGEPLANMRHQESRIESDLKRDFPNGHTKADVEDLWAKHEQKFPRNEVLDPHTRNYADDVAAALHALHERAPARAPDQAQQRAQDRVPSDVQQAVLRAAERESPREQPRAEERVPADVQQAVLRAVAARETPPQQREERVPADVQQAVLRAVAARETPPQQRITPDERAAIQASAQERIVRPINDVRTDRQPLADDRSIDRDRTPTYFRDQAAELKARGGKEWDLVKDDMETLRSSRAVQTPEKLSRNLDAIAAEREVIRVTDPERAGLLNVRALALAALMNEADQRPTRQNAKDDVVEDQVLKMRAGSPILETPSGFIRDIRDVPREQQREQTREVTASMIIDEPAAGEQVVFMRAARREERSTSPTREMQSPVERTRSHPGSEEMRALSDEFRGIGDQLRSSMREDALASNEGRALLTNILTRLNAAERSTPPTRRIAVDENERTKPLTPAALDRQDHSRPDDLEQQLRASLRDDVLARIQHQRDEPSLEDLLDDDRTAVVPREVDLDSTEDRLVAREEVAKLARSENSVPPPPRAVPLDPRPAPGRDDEATTRISDVRTFSVGNEAERHQQDAPTASLRSPIVRDILEEAQTQSLPMVRPPNSIVRGRDHSVDEVFTNARIEPRVDQLRPILDSHRDDMLRGFSAEGLSVRDAHAMRMANVAEGVTNARIDFRARAHPDFDAAKVEQARARIADEPGLQTYKELSRYVREQTDPNEAAAAIGVMASLWQQAEQKLDARVMRAREQLDSLSPEQRDARQEQARQALERNPDIANWGYQQSALRAYELGMLPHTAETRETIQAIHTLMLTT